MNHEDLLAHSRFIRKLALSLVADEHVAADLSQEVWVRALKSPPDAHVPLRFWISDSLRKVFRITRRSEMRRRVREKAAALPEGMPSAEEIVEEEEARRRVVDAVLGLEEPYRSTIILRYYRELSLRDVARRTGAPLETVRTRLKRGLARLRRRLDAEYRSDGRRWGAALLPLAGLKTADAIIPTVLSGTVAMTTKVKIGIAAALLVGATLLLYQLVFHTPSRESFFTSDGEGSIAGLEDEAALVHTGEKDSTFSSEEDSTIVGISPSNSGIMFACRVYDKSTFEPVVQGRVVLTPLPRSDDDLPLQGTTDASGQWTVSIPSTGEQEECAYQVHISAECYMDLVTRLPPLNETMARSFYLEANPVHRIRITDSSGRPLPEAGADFIAGDVYSKQFQKTRKVDAEGWITFSEGEFTYGSIESRNVALRIFAPSMSDHLTTLKRIVAQGDLDSEIRLSPMGSYAGRVIDRESETGIAGAKVCLYPRSLWLNHLGNDFFDSLSTESDLSGFFKVPRATFPEDLLSYIVTANGYSSYFTLPGKKGLPDRIALVRRNETDLPKPVLLQGRVLNSENNEPIPHIKMTIGSNVQRELEVLTDASGGFSYSFQPLQEDPFYSAQVRADGYRTTRVHNLKVIKLKHETWTIHLTPVLPWKLKVTVRDELFRPIPGASVSAKYWEGKLPEKYRGGKGNPGIAFGRSGREVYTNQIRTTDENGEAKFGFGITRKTSALVKIRCPGFCDFISEDFLLGLEENTEQAFTLRRGILFQKIKVVDVAGSPVPQKELKDTYQARPWIIADLKLEGGNVLSIHSNIREKGLCEMVFPPFQDGVIYVGKRPDTGITIQYDTILRDDWITLVLMNEYKGEASISGVVRDQFGAPVEGMSFGLYDAGREPPKHFQSGKTGEGGAFKIPVIEKGTYHLEWTDTLIGDRWLTNDIRYTVTGGALLDITVQSYNGVYVDSFELQLKKFGGADYKFETWLETEKGDPIEVSKVKKNYARILFLDVPDGRYRACIESKEDGKRYYTPLFEVEEGRSPRVTVNLKEGGTKE